MFNRRQFLQTSGLSSVALLLKSSLLAQNPGKNNPIVISTWAPNVKANAAAWEILVKGGRALDAVEKGVQVPEADPADQSVGYGGLPDRDGKVTLDACIMDENGNCGAVMALEHIMHPITVARLVMEKTPHVQLVGAGALQFALTNGFKKENLLTPESEKAGGIFLVFKSTLEIHHKLEKVTPEKQQVKKAPTVFSAVIMQIVLVDAVFSFDSILTAIGLVDQVWVMITA